MEEQRYFEQTIHDSKDNVFSGVPIEQSIYPFAPEPPNQPSHYQVQQPSLLQQPSRMCSFMASPANQTFQNYSTVQYPSFAYPQVTPQLYSYQSSSSLPGYNYSIHSPQSVSYFPSTNISSPPISPDIIPRPLSYPLIQPQTIQYSQFPTTFQNCPLSFHQQQSFQQTVGPSSSSSSSMSNSGITPNSLTQSTIKTEILQDADAILDEAIETAIIQNDLSIPDTKQTASSSSLSTSDDPEISHQKTLFEETLETIDDAQLNSYMTSGFIRPASVKRKMNWTDNMYRAFCNRLNVDMFPLNGRVVSAFLHMLAHDCRYAITSLSNVIYPSLVHLQQDAGCEVDPAETAIIRAKLKSLQLDPHVKKEGRGKEPLCWFDVLELINRIPDSLITKDMEASLFLFALQTGSRACTCCGVTWGDITHYELDEETGASRVIILQRVTKGNQNWQHKVKLEGFIDQPNNGDFLYFLERHSQKTLQKSVKDIAQGNISEDIKKEQVWKLSVDAMRERLKVRLEQAGFPIKHFSFHSFRSGFICSSLLLAGRDPAQQGSVLDHTAFIAGWVPYGKAQKRYVKTVAEVMIVASRLVGAGIGLRKTNEEDNNQREKEVHVIASDRKKNSSQYNKTNNNSIIIIEKNTSEASSSTTPITISSSNVQAASVGFIQTPKSIEEFHNFILEEPHFGVQGLINTVKLLFKTKLGISTESTNDQRRVCNNAWIRALTIIGKNSLLGKGQTKTTWAQNRLEGHQIIERKLTDHTEDPTDIAEEMYDLIKDLYNIQSPPQKQIYHTTFIPIEPNERPMLTDQHGKAIRSRLRWNDDENAKLLDYYQEHHTFSQITSVLPNRTTADACAHYRHLKKKQTGNDTTAIDPAANSQN